MYVSLYDFFSIIVLLTSTGFGISVIFLLVREYLQDRNPQVWGIIAYLLSLICIHLVSFLALKINGELPSFGDRSNLLSLLSLISRGSMFLSVPFFIHSLYPNEWSGKLQWFFNMVGILFIVFKLIGIFPELPGFSIGSYIFLTVCGTYAIIYGSISALKISSSIFKKTKEYIYSLAAMIVFLFTVPFMLTADFSLIPLGILEGKFYIMPYHALGISLAFFLVSISRKWTWMKDLPPSMLVEIRGEGIGERVEELLHKKGLSPRELEVFPYLVEDHSYKEIADLLCISPATVKTHALNIYRKLDVKKKSQLRDLL